jgi:predicted transcriptional regulator
MTTISLKIPEELRAELEAEARRQQKAKSHIIRQALTAGLLRARHARRQSLYERAEDLIQDCRCPRDLSTNSRHLRDYGA